MVSEWIASDEADPATIAWVVSQCCGIEMDASDYCGGEELQANRSLGEGYTCGDPRVSEWIASDDADPGTIAWIVSQCCGTEMYAMEDGSCLCGDLNFYEGLEIPYWEGRKCGADENSWACKAETDDEKAGADYMRGICCGAASADEANAYAESLKDGSCLCGNMTFLEGKTIGDWGADRTCSEDENSWACNAETDDQKAGADYMRGICCEEATSAAGSGKGGSGKGNRSTSNTSSISNSTNTSSGKVGKGKGKR